MNRYCAVPMPLRRVLSTEIPSGLVAPYSFKLSRFEDISVDTWSIYLPNHFSSIESFRKLLNSQEIIRADGFHFPTDCSRFMIAHGALRMILADYVQMDPMRLRFSTGRHGKPEIDRELKLPDIHFNLSHSGGMAVIAVSLDYEVGIDIERIEPKRANLAIAERYFSSREVASLKHLPDAEQAVAFFTCWTRKEAYIKGRGEGLSIPLRDFDVSLTAGEPAALLASRVDPSDIDQWRLLELPTLDGYLASLAVKRM